MFATQGLKVRLPIWLCAGIAGVTAVMAIGAFAVEQKRRKDDPWKDYPKVQDITEPWLRDPVMSDAEVGLPTLPPGYVLDKKVNTQAEQEKQEREHKRKLRAVYECILHNASRMGGRDTETLERMCWDFPDLR